MRSTPIGKTSPAFSGDVLFQPVSFILTTVCTAPGAGPDLVLSLPPQHTNEGVPQDASRLSPTAQVSVGKAGLWPRTSYTLPQTHLSTAERSLSHDEWTDLFTTLSN